MPDSLLALPLIDVEQTLRSTDPAAVLLANLYVSANSTVDNLQVVDTRQRGGGLSSNSNIRKTTLTREQQSESQTLWDLGSWDGTVALTNGKVVIKVPATKLIENGGDFTREQIDEIISRNLPVGIFPIVQYI